MSRAPVLLCTLLALAAAVAVATPIPNGSFATRTVGWFDGNDKSCPEICRGHRAVAEREKNTAPPVENSYVCKIRKARGGPYKWLFGSQFDSRPACYTTDRDLKGEYSQIFYCLCVRLELKRSELAPGVPDPTEAPVE